MQAQSARRPFWIIERWYRYIIVRDIVDKDPKILG